MLDKNDLGMLYNLIERVEVSGKEVEEVYKLKMKLIGILKMIGQKEHETNQAKIAAQNETLNVNGGATLMPSVGFGSPMSSGPTSMPTPQGTGMLNASLSPDGTIPNISATTDESAEQSATTGQSSITN